MFGSIFNTYHGAPILCCTTTDLVFLCKVGIFGTVLKIFGVAFVGPCSGPIFLDGASQKVAPVIKNCRYTIISMVKVG